MLIFFGLDSDALRTSYGDQVVRRSVHKRLLELWAKFGVLVADSELAEIKTTIEQLPQELRKLWQDSLRHQRIQSGEPNWIYPSAIESELQIQAYKGKLSLLLLEETRAVIAGLPPEKGSVMLASPPLEICRFDCADQSQSFSDAQNFSCSTIAAGQKVSSVWNERFHSLTSQTRSNIIIVDRYAAESHIERRDGFSGLRRALMEIDAEPKKRIITIYTASKRHSESDMVSAMKILVAGMRRGGLGEVNVNICPDADFGCHVHHRYLRFEQSVCFLDVGVEVFAGQVVYRDCLLNMRLVDNSVRSWESGLRAMSNSHKVR